MLKYAAFLWAGWLALRVLAGVALAQEAVVVAIQVSPSTINLAHQGQCVTVHADIPYRGVLTASLTLNGVEVWYTKSDARGNLVAKFHVDEVKAIIAEPSAELTLSGEVETPEGGVVPFSGTDTVRVVDNGGKR